jgi:hypothetical protein
MRPGLSNTKHQSAEKIDRWGCAQIYQPLAHLLCDNGKHCLIPRLFQFKACEVVMAANSVGNTRPLSSLVEFSANRSTDKARSVHQIPRHDVLQYIHEMCATLSYMSIAHNCGRLSDLFAAAHAEAEREMEIEAARSVKSTTKHHLVGVCKETR